LLACWLWFTLAVQGAKKHRRLTAFVLSAALFLCMVCQLRLLWLDGLLNTQTALPLHLCSFSAIISILLCLRFQADLYHFLLLLGLPGALLALLFPAVTPCSHPLLMRNAFFHLHVLIIAVTLYLKAQEKPLPTNPKRVFLLGNGFLLLAACVNRITGSNYMFLHAAPARTPLALLIVHGYDVYITALELLCMLLLQQLCHLYLRNQESI